MKTINLNIKISDIQLPEVDAKLKGYEVSKRYIGMAFFIFQQQPDARGIAQGMQLSDQRKVYIILDALEKCKDIVELEDDRFEFLEKTFSKVKWVGGTKIIVRLADRIEEAKEKEKAKKEAKEKKEEPEKEKKDPEKPKIKNKESVK